MLDRYSFDGVLYDVPLTVGNAPVGGEDRLGVILEDDLERLLAGVV